MSDVPLKILKALIKEDTPLTLSTISKKIEEVPQLTEYHLKKLIQAGILFRLNTDETITYELQQFYYDEETINVLYQMLLPFAEVVHAELLQSKQDRTSNDLCEITINNLRLLLLLFHDDLGSLFQNGF